MGNINSLKDAWIDVEKNADNTKQWVTRVSRSVAGIKSSAESIYDTMDEIRAVSKRMKKICSNNAGIGLFGESQVGKSFLVSTIASDRGGRLITEIGGREYDFIEKINPSGGGKESTGLVTRFTTKKFSIINEDYPVRLQLLQENEIIKIIVNSFNNDFKTSGNRDVNEKEINETLNIFSAKTLPKDRTERISFDEIFSLDEYISGINRPLYEKLGATYWRLARKKVIYLDINERAAFFSLLWGGARQQKLTELYKKLTKALTGLNPGDSEFVYAGTDKLIIDRNAPGGSIINVDAINRLSAHDDYDYMCTVVNERNVSSEISLAELAALTAEITLVIKNPERNIINKMDLLDFPGYRGRLSIGSLSDSSGDDTRTTEASVFLRGKVAYLFEKYTENLEVNSLIFCASSDNQINTKMEEVVSRWINSTQGKTPKIRSEHAPGLIYALTKFDKRISEYIDKNSYSFGKSGLLYQAVLEKFGNESWFKNWDGTGDNEIPFRNIFLVRKPGLRQSVVFDCDDGIEHGIAEKHREAVEKMRREFIEDADIQKYINEPEETWNAVMARDGGMERICSYIDSLDIDSIREKAIRDRLSDYCIKGRSSVDSWYKDSDDKKESDKKMKQFKKLVNFVGVDYTIIRKMWGDVLNLFNLPDHVIKDLYMNADLIIDDDNEDTKDGADDNGRGSGSSGQPESMMSELSSISSFDDEAWDSVLSFSDDAPNSQVSLPDDGVISSGGTPVRMTRLKFGEQVYYKWIERLERINDIELEENLQPVKSHLMFIAKELILFGNRTGLKDKLLQKEEEISIRNNKKEDIVRIMIRAVKLLISDTVTYFGKKDIFALKKLDDSDMPVLSEKPESPAVIFCSCWIKQFLGEIKTSLGQNAYGISYELNEELGRLIRKFEFYEDYSG